MLNLNKKIIPLILIGGKSQRMGGGIKSFIKLNNKDIFSRILERITPQIEKIIINCNIKEKKLTNYGLPIIQDIKKGYLGPLAGIHTAMNWININEPKIEWLVTLPGDTPFIPFDLISRFKEKLSSKSKIIIAQSANKNHPIIGLWHISLYKSLDEELTKGVRKIMSWAELHPIEYINFPISKFDPFFNINTKEDIKTALRIEKEFL